MPYGNNASSGKSFRLNVTITLALQRIAAASTWIVGIRENKPGNQRFITGHDGIRYRSIHQT